MKTGGFVFEGFKKSPRRVGIQTLTAFVVLIGKMAKCVGGAKRNGGSSNLVRRFAHEFAAEFFSETS